MLCLKQSMVVAVIRLSGSLFQVLGPTFNELCIRNFDSWKGNLNFLLQEHMTAPLLSTVQKTLLK